MTYRERMLEAIQYWQSRIDELREESASIEMDLQDIQVELMYAEDTLDKAVSALENHQSN